jgi:hypothetical protein
MDFKQGRVLDMHILIRALIFLGATSFFWYSVAYQHSTTLSLAGGAALIGGLYFSFARWSDIKQIFDRRTH